MHILHHTRIHIVPRGESGERATLFDAIIKVKATMSSPSLSFPLCLLMFLSSVSLMDLENAVINDGITQRRDDSVYPGSTSSSSYSPAHHQLFQRCQACAWGRQWTLEGVKLGYIDGFCFTTFRLFVHHTHHALRTLLFMQFLNTLASSWASVAATLMMGSRSRPFPSTEVSLRNLIFMRSFIASLQGLYSIYAIFRLLTSFYYTPQNDFQECTAQLDFFIYELLTACPKNIFLVILSTVVKVRFLSLMK